MRTTASILMCPLVALLALAPAIGAMAEAGRAEIGQACAVQTGCFPGDAAGFPVTIDGSAGTAYELTSDLTVTDPALDGIEITADGVDLLLNGFQVAGPIVCTGSGAAISCGNGAGLGIDGSAAVETTVSSGSVVGFGMEGVFLGDRSRVERVFAGTNGRDGIRVGFYSSVLASIAHRNGRWGVYLVSNSTLRHSVARGNGSNGFVGGGTATENASSGNGGRGFSGWAYGVLRSNAASGNDDDGFSSGESALISDNTSYANAGSGFVAGSDSSLQRNASSSNDGYGFALQDPDVFYRENAINDNTTGTVLGGGLNAGFNVCDGVASCP